MVVAKNTRGKKRKITSTLFNDIKLYKDSIADLYTTTSYRERHTSMREKIGEIKLRAVVQEMLLSKLGCYEVSEYIKQYKGDLKDIVPDYGPAQPYESYDDMTKELEKLNAVTIKTDDDLARIDELQKEIKDIDDFCEAQLDLSRSGQTKEKEQNYRRGTIW